MFPRNPRRTHWKCWRRVRHLKQAPPGTHRVPSHAGNVQWNQGNHPGREERQVNRKCGHFPPLCVTNRLSGRRRSRWLPPGRTDVLLSLLWTNFSLGADLSNPFFEWRFEKKSFTVLGIFMTFEDYRKTINLELLFYLLCYYLVVEHILNIFLFLTMVILFFWSKNLDLFAYFVN